jgi:endonuclease/exonuclease/phosphatase family metal-dependent hydrolase
MRALVAGFVIVVLAISVSPSLTTQEPAPAQAEAPRRPRIVVELSELITHSPFETCSSSGAPADPPTRIRIGSWNIRAAQSAPVDMLAAEMHAMQADIFALQEVDVRTRRGGFVDEPTDLATALGYHYAFAASIKWDEGHYGLAVLSRWPLIDVKRHRVESAPDAEPRIVLEAAICAAGRPLHLLNHHADRRPPSRALGFADLRRLVQPNLGHGILVLGDLNEYPDDPGVRSLIDEGLVDLADGAADTVSAGRVDYLLVDAPLARVASPARVWTTDKSDHHALLVDLAW